MKIVIHSLRENKVWGVHKVITVDIEAAEESEVGAEIESIIIAQNIKESTTVKAKDEVLLYQAIIRNIQSDNFN